MLQISAQMLAMSGEYAVLEKNGRVIYANSAARNLLESDCVLKAAANRIIVKDAMIKQM